MKGNVFRKVTLAAAVCALTIPAMADDEDMTTHQPPTMVVTPADFVWNAGLINLEEIRLGQVAETNSQDKAVQEFGRHMVRDHTKLNDRLARIANQEGLQWPEANSFYIEATSEQEKPATELMGQNPEERLREAQMDAQHLESLSGTDFDRAYADAMVSGHEKAVQCYEDAVSSLTDPALKKYAEHGLHVVRHHLKMAQKLDQRVGGGNLSGS
ncbi:MAG: DUF4142 domain-containing protein [Limisphaerales bacterium]